MSPLVACERQVMCRSQQTPQSSALDLHSAAMCHSTCACSLWVPAGLRPLAAPLGLVPAHHRGGWPARTGCAGTQPRRYYAAEVLLWCRGLATLPVELHPRQAWCCRADVQPGAAGRGAAHPGAGLRLGFPLPLCSRQVPWCDSGGCPGVPLQASSLCDSVDDWHALCTAPACLGVGANMHVAALGPQDALGCQRRPSVGSRL